jgi:hypothetical protein
MSRGRANIEFSEEILNKVRAFKKVIDAILKTQLEESGYLKLVWKGAAESEKAAIVK